MGLYALSIGNLKRIVTFRSSGGNPLFTVDRIDAGANEYAGFGLIANGSGEFGPVTSGGTGSGDVTGPGSATDNALARFDGTGGKTIQNSTVIADDSGNMTVPGHVSITTAGKGLKIKEGSNAMMGVATLVAGTVTVSTTAVTASSRIFLCIQALAGGVGQLSVANVVAGTSFDINSTDGADTSTIAWLIVEPA